MLRTTSSSFTALSRSRAHMHRLLIPATSIIARDVRTSSVGKQKHLPILPKVPSIQVARDPQSLAEMIVRTTDDNVSPQILAMLQNLRKTALGNKPINKALSMAGYDWDNFPGWFQEWLKNSLTVAEKYDPFPLALPKVPKETTEQILSEISVYLFCSRQQKSTCFVDFLLNHTVPNRISYGLSSFKGLPYRRYPIAIHLAGNLQAYLDDSKLIFVRDILRRYYHKEILREHLISALSSRLSLHVDVLQPLFEYILGDRKRELGIFTYSKKYNRAQVIQGLRREITLLMWRRQQLDIDSKVTNEDFELPLSMFFPDSSKESISEASFTVDIAKQIPATMRKNFNFLQQRIYIGIHHMFQLNLQGLRIVQDLPPLSLSDDPSSKKRASQTLSETAAAVAATISSTGDIANDGRDVMAIAAKAIGGKFLETSPLTSSSSANINSIATSNHSNVSDHSNSNNNNSTNFANASNKSVVVPASDYLREVSLLDPDGDKSSEPPEDSAETSSSSGGNWIYAKLSQETVEERLKSRSNEYDFMLAQINEGEDKYRPTRRASSETMSHETPIPTTTIIETPTEVETQQTREEIAAMKAKLAQETQAKVIEKIVARDRFACSKRKVLIKNLPTTITEPQLRNALRNIGPVKHVVIYSHAFTAEPMETQRKKSEAASSSSKDVSSSPPSSSSSSSASPTKRKRRNVTEMTAAELDTTETQNPMDGDDTDHLGADDDDDDMEEEDAMALGEDDHDPLNMFATVETLASVSAEARGGVAAAGDTNSANGDDANGENAKKRVKRKPVVRRKIVEHMKLLGNRVLDQSDTYAFVTMADDDGYAKLTSDVMSIFGLSIDRRACKTIPASKMTYFVVELHYPMRISNILHTINILLDNEYKLSMIKRVTDDRIKPLFLRLDFPSHEECWEAYNLLGKNPIINNSSIRHPRLPANHVKNAVAHINEHTPIDAAWHLSWIRTQNYWELSKRARRSLEGLEYKFLQSSDSNAKSNDPKANDAGTSTSSSTSTSTSTSVVDGRSKLDDILAAEAMGEYELQQSASVDHNNSSSSQQQGQS